MSKENFKSAFVFLATLFASVLYFYVVGSTVATFLLGLVFVHGAGKLIRKFTESEIPGRIYRGTVISLAFVIAVLWILGVLSIVSAQIIWKYVKFGVSWFVVLLGLLFEGGLLLVYTGLEYVIEKHQRATNVAVDKVNEFRDDLKK